MCMHAHSLSGTPETHIDLDSVCIQHSDAHKACTHKSMYAFMQIYTQRTQMGALCTHQHAVTQTCA